MKTMEITETERKLIIRITELESQVRYRDGHIGELQFEVAVWKKRYMDTLEWLEELQKKFK